MQVCRLSITDLGCWKNHSIKFAPVYYPIIRMIEDGIFDKDSKKSELVIWKTPNQLKTLVAGGKATVHPF